MNPLKKKPRTKSQTSIPSKPEWMKVRISFPKEADPVAIVRNQVAGKRLNTVCESASCPNLNHCWSRKTATYMLSGDICTRRCGYCDVAFGKPGALDPDEPLRVANSVLELELNHVVLTAVNRDDLADGGAGHFAETVRQIRKLRPNCVIEVLIPDFKAKQTSLDCLYESMPNIINHNIETVKELFSHVAPQKNYERSLFVLKNIAEQGFVTKSGIILGLGEKDEHIEACLKDLFHSGVRMLTIGQYLQPTPSHYPLQRYVTPEEFQLWKTVAVKIGFKHVSSGPLVRSSYHADEQIDSVEALNS